jgi:Ca2+-transporting ATPase
MPAPVSPTPANGSTHPNLAQGLTLAQVAERLARDGRNELPQSEARGPLTLLVEVVKEPMFLLLVGCGSVYIALGDRLEALMLMASIAAVMALSFVQQRRADQALAALREIASPRASVVREGQLCSIDGRDLVVGDWVLLGEGDRVPADIELNEVSNLQVDESMLTGESVPVSKLAYGAVDHPAAVDGEQRDASRVFSGSWVTAGSAKGHVVATGRQSALGQIGKTLEGLEDIRTPIQIETRTVVKRAALGSLLIAGLLALIGGLRSGQWLQSVLAGLTFAIAMIPEELPVVLTLFTGLGAWRMARQKVLTRQLSAIEMLGATTVLCVDKTGTLTRNQMTVRAVWAGQLQQSAQWIECGDSALPPTAQDVLTYAALASHRQAFDPMETALNRAAAQAKAKASLVPPSNDLQLVEDYGLSPQMMAMSRVWQTPGSQHLTIAAKGAPEAVVDLCHLPQAFGQIILEQVATMAERGYRVLGVARAEVKGHPLPADQHDFAFEWVGLVALQDPVKKEVPEAIAECQAAGIRIVMMTGDHQATALAIGREAGLSTQGAAISGTELDTLGDDALDQRLATTTVFCRAKPTQKLRLVQALRRRGEVVAMTGDGVNDAPALKAAHIGVAMGAKGTDVARQAASLVLLDDNFSSLVGAIRHGRRVVANMRKAIVFVVAVHLPIAGLSLLPVLMGWPLLLMPVHVLFLELIIDPACAMVFEAQPLEAGAMQQHPRDVRQRLFDRKVLITGIVQGVGVLLVLLLLFVASQEALATDAQSRGLCFGVLVLGTLALIQVNRSDGRSVIEPFGPGGSVAARPKRLTRLVSTTRLNRPFVAVLLLSVTMLGAIFSLPVLQSVFGFEKFGQDLVLMALVALILIGAWLAFTKWALKQFFEVTQ